MKKPQRKLDKGTRRIYGDFFAIIIIVSFIVVVANIFNLFDIVNYYTHSKNDYTKNELIIILFIVVIFLFVFSIRRWRDLNYEIKERKIAERKMQESRAQLQAVLDGVPDMILQVDQNLRIVWANEAALRKNPKAIGTTSKEAFSLIGESVIDRYCKWAMVTGIIEKGIKFQPARFDEGGSTYWEGIGVPLKSKGDEIFGAIGIARDVTDRMRQEHQWNLLASIVESTDDAIYGMGFDGTIISWNIGAEKIYGYTAQEIVGLPCGKFIPIEYRKQNFQVIENVIRKQQLQRFETVRRRKDGEEIFVSVTICPFVDAKGKKIGVSSIDRDITVRKKAEEALLESERRFRQMAETINDVFWLTDRINNKLLFVSPEYERIWGRSSKALHENLRDWINAVHPDDKLKIIESSNKVVDRNGYDQEFRVIHPDGNLYWIRERAFPIRDEFGVVYRVAGITSDITARKQAEEALRKSEEKFRTLVTTAPDGIILTEANGIIIEANEAFAILFGRRREDVLNLNILDFLPVKNRRIEIVKIMRHLQRYDYSPASEITAINRDGDNIPLEISVAALKDNFSNILNLIVIVRDISMRKRYEYELQNSREQLRNLAMHLQSAREEEKKRIAFEIHDELGYALTALKLDLAWLAGRFKMKENYLFDKIKSMTELVETTIQKVRTISTQLRPSILDHFGLIAAIEWQANEFQKRTAVRCRVSCEPKEMVFEDQVATSFFRIFQETLTNIARHAKATRVDVSFNVSNGIAELKVSDNGVGITSEQINNHKSLGLIGMRERADFLGGTVEIQSEPNFGTTIILKVPISEKKELVND